MTSPGTPPKLINIANILTASRIVLVPAVLVLLWLIKPEANQMNWRHLQVSPPMGRDQLYSILAVIFFTVASLTDLLDGYLARKYKLVTNLGKLLDPLADKILVLGTMVFLVALNRLPGWMVVVVLSRELAVTSLRGVAGADGVVIAASKLGKYKTVFQDFALGFVMLYYPVHGANVYMIGMIFMMAAVILTIWSGIDYFWAFRKPLKG
jgi:CDP-diacylglycerol--glycerol-3-phosphate 3-phosphatidyltransferase